MAEEKRGFYLFVTWGDVEPEVIGPFPSEDARNDKAKEIRQEEGDENGIFMLDIVDGKPETYAYSGGFFEEDEKE